MVYSQEKEKASFNGRIEERDSAGFVPDLRRLNKCVYFYKSFWREPYFANLYVGEMFRNYLKAINAHGQGMKILDVGCGGGYFSLELARHGHHVYASDISDKCIEIARETLAENTYTENFGSLCYEVQSFDEISVDEYDVVLFSGVLHHLPDVKKAVEKAFNLLKHDGILVSHEPCHERWTKKEAAQVLLVRSLLSLTGHWYEGKLGEEMLETESLCGMIDQVLEEYVEERDPHEAHQSPHDNTSTGEYIKSCIQGVFNHVRTAPSFSFLYRVIGGLRGEERLIHKIADLLYLYDKETTQQGIFEPNYFYITASK